MNTPDLIGLFHLFIHSGKYWPVHSSYRPLHKIHDNYFSSGEHHYPEKDLIALGETGLAHITLLTPQAYPKSIWLGRTLEVYEGVKQVGIFKVTEILNPILLIEAKDFCPHWGVAYLN